MDISLLSAIDQSYRIPFEVMAASLLRTKQPATAVEWHVFTEEPGDCQSWLAGMNARYSVHNATFVIHRPRWLGDETLPIRGRTRPIVYARLLAPEQAPLSTARALFLDADILVVGPIEELWRTDLASRPCACVQDLAIPTVSSGMGIADPAWWNDDAHRRYFNAGLMLIDVKAWKDQGVKDKALAYLARSGNTVNMFDQEALNVALGGDWQRLSYRWNLIASLAGRAFLDTTFLDMADYEDSLRRPGIIHYAGRLKPWQNLHLKGRWYDDYRAELRQAVPEYRVPFDLRHRLGAVYDAYVRRWAYPLENAVWRARRGF